MPHLVLEYSSNIKQPVDIPGLLERLHESIVSVGDFDVEDFKSRAHVCEPYRVGAGDTRRAFVHLEVRVLDRNDLERRRRIGERALQALRETFRRALDECDCDLTVEVRTMELACYFKERSRPIRHRTGESDRSG